MIYWIVFIWAVVQFLLLVGKLAGIITWSWDWVYLPLWLAGALLFFLGIVLVALWLAAQAFEWFLITII